MTCLVCSSPALRILSSKRKTFFRCADCGFSFLHPDFLPSKEAALERYKQHYNSEDNKGYQQFLCHIIERALYYAGKPESLIDWGSGPNPLASKILRNLGFTVFSWDPHFSSAQDPERACYDLGICVEVAEHFIHPQEDFSAFFATLKPNAYAIVHTHLAPKDDGAFLRWWYVEDVTHVSFYSPCSLEILGKMNGAELITVEDEKLAVFIKG